jgi:pantetheine-phosphate adenylyltransferase|tara:strand:+ start:717 stop:1799 length:1083 start_codon:yes stop_codon:yes gene_type:complete
MKVAVTPRGTPILELENTLGVNMHNIGLIGGTFDRFHAGHKKLIIDALKKCRMLEIWIISDNIAKSKNPLIMDWEDRKKEILNNLKTEYLENIKFGILNDDYGPAPSHPDATAIICTAETREMCITINQKRKDNSLDGLEIIQIEHADAWDGLPISSTRIRNGEIDRQGKSWVEDIWSSESLLMTEKASQGLKIPFGDLIEGPENEPEYAMKNALFKYHNSISPLIAVGDVTTLTMQKLGICADIALIDGKTKRKSWGKSSEIISSKYDESISCINPPGELTISLLNACKDAISNWSINGSTSLILVKGEEDLAPLIIHLLSPLGAVIIYGQPGKGIVVRITEEETKLRCKRILSNFIQK